MSQKPLLFSLSLLLFVASMGFFFGSQRMNMESAEQPLELHAQTAKRSAGLSMATGLIDGNNGCLYVMDHDAETLRCYSFDQRTGETNGIFSANVAQDMGFDKIGGARYTIISSQLLQQRDRSAGNRAALSSCFVADQVSGKVIGYKTSYDKKKIVSGRRQQGKLVPVFREVVRSE